MEKPVDDEPVDDESEIETEVDEEGTPDASEDRVAVDDEEEDEKKEVKELKVERVVAAEDEIKFDADEELISIWFVDGLLSS